jgi:drug/metabolite transporter (DMT)-like permease
MAKLLLILLIGLVFESAGVVLLKKGMAQVGGVDSMRVSEIVRVVKAGITSPQILLGVFFEALFFLSLLILLGRADISFLWPMTGLSFVFATLAAVIFLHEHVSALRWAGVVLVMLGAALITYSEHQRERAPAAAQQNATVHSGSGLEHS